MQLANATKRMHNPAKTQTVKTTKQPGVKMSRNLYKYFILHVITA